REVSKTRTAAGWESFHGLAARDGDRLAAGPEVARKRWVGRGEVVLAGGCGGIPVGEATRRGRNPRTRAARASASRVGTPCASAPERARRGLDATRGQHVKVRIHSARTSLDTPRACRLMCRAYRTGPAL